MKKTFFTDVLRNISRHKVAFASVVMITMLAVMSYLGILYSSEGIRRTSDVYFRDTNLRDFEINSTLLLGEEDIKAVKNRPGVADAEGVLQVNARLAGQEENKNVTVVSLTERINLAELKEGRLPETEQECVLESELFTQMKFSLGDTIRLLEEGESQSSFLKYTELTVVGHANHADHISNSTSDPSRRYVLVSPGLFDLSSVPFESACMKLVIQLDKPRDMHYFTPEYEQLLQQVRGDLERFSEQQALAREASVKKEAAAAVKEGEEKLSASRQQLEAARAQLESGEKELAEGEKQLAESKEELDKGKKQVEEGEALLEKNKKELEKAKAQLQEAGSALEAGWTELESGGKTLQEASPELEAARAQLEEGASQLQEARKALEEGEALLKEGRLQLSGAWTQVAQGESQLKASFGQMEQIKTLVRNGIRQAVSDIAGEPAAGEISWAAPRESFDVGDPNLTPAVFNVTDTIAVDFRRPMDQVLAGILAPLADQLEEVPGWEEAFREALRSRLYQEVNAVYQDISAQMAAWDQGQEAYLQGRSQVMDAEAQYQAKNREYESGRSAYESAYQTFAAGQAEYEAALADYLKGKDAYEEGLVKYAGSMREYAEGLKQYQAGEAAFLEAEKEWELGKLKLESGQAAYEGGLAQLEEARSRLESGRKQYEEGLEACEAGEKQLEEAKKQLEALGSCHFVLLGPDANSGYFLTKSVSHDVGNLGMTFAFLFVVIAALVIYATVKRMVSEQRKQVGTTKALGFFTGEVAVKYLSFGCLGAVLGILLGILLGFFALQTVILNANKLFFQKDLSVKLAFLPGVTAIVLAAGLILAACSVWTAVAGLIREPARDLMQDAMPKVRHRQGKNSESRHSLYFRLILRNIRSDFGRVLITIISIAGCCTLLVIGFTVRSNISKTINREYDDIILYEETLSFDDTANPEAANQLESILREEGVEYVSLYSEQLPFRVGDYDLLNASVICSEQDRMGSFLRLTDGRGGTVSLPEEGILVTQQMAEFYGMRAGDSLTIYDSRMEAYKAVIQGSFEKYFYGGIVMTPAAYRSLFGQEARDNTYWLKQVKDRNALESRLKQIKGFESLSSTESTQKSFQQISSIVTLITVLLIVMAGVMAYFVLLNLVSMYVIHKTRELTIMRINGFTTREAVRYVAGESFLTTGAGILLGMVLGTFLGLTILKGLEQAIAGYVLEIDWKGCLISALITIVYAVVINKLALRPVRHLKLTDIS